MEKMIHKFSDKAPKRLRGTTITFKRNGNNLQVDLETKYKLSKHESRYVKQTVKKFLAESGMRMPIRMDHISLDPLKNEENDDAPREINS